MENLKNELQTISLSQTGTHSAINELLQVSEEKLFYEFLDIDSLGDGLNCASRRRLREDVTDLRTDRRMDGWTDGQTLL